MTPEQIQQARELARDWVDNNQGECEGAYELGVAVLALTEQLAESEAARKRLADFIAESPVLALTEQQPEPVSESREADRVSFASYRMYMSDWRADGMDNLTPPLDLDELENPSTESARLVWEMYLRRTRAAFGVTRKAGA